LKLPRIFRWEKRQTLEEILIQGGVLATSVSKAQALNIPTVTACIDLICGTIASLPINLYKQSGDRTKPIDDDRTALLNEDTNDTLNSYAWKWALVEDYLMAGAGYSYINRSRNTVKSLNYVENSKLTVLMNVDPIFKKGQIQVNGETYRDFQFIKLPRKSKDGLTGKGILKENNVMLSVAYNQMIFEESMIKNGGNKRGFLKSATRLSKEAMDELKLGWKNLYQNNSENVLVLNNGIDFAEASQTAVELQLNEQKNSNAAEIGKLFLVPVNVLAGTASDEEYNNWLKTCILPILSAFETALNKDLLLPSEKQNLYFAFDTSSLFAVDIEKRYKAYEIAVKNGILQTDEIRFKENYPSLNLPFVKLGLQDVLLNVKTHEIYTPNTNKVAKMGEEVQTQPNTPPTQPQGGPPNEGVSDNVRLGKENQQPQVPNQTK
jgi:HK97 family phage portal protein